MCVCVCVYVKPHYNYDIINIFDLRRNTYLISMLLESNALFGTKKNILSEGR